MSLRPHLAADFLESGYSENAERTRHGNITPRSPRNRAVCVCALLVFEQLDSELHPSWVFFFSYLACYTVVSLPDYSTRYQVYGRRQKARLGREVWGHAVRRRRRHCLYSMAVKRSCGDNYGGP